MFQYKTITMERVQKLEKSTVSIDYWLLSFNNDDVISLESVQNLNKTLIDWVIN